MSNLFNQKYFKFFDQSEFEEKSNSILALLDLWIHRTSQHWSRQNPFSLFFQVTSRFFWRRIIENFSTNENWKKNEIQFVDFQPIGTDGGVITDLDKINFAFCLKSQVDFFQWKFFKIFRPIRIREKIEFNYSIFLSLESTDKWTLMLKKFYCPLSYSRNRWEKNFF